MEVSSNEEQCDLEAPKITTKRMDVVKKLSALQLHKYIRRISLQQEINTILASDLPTITDNNDITRNGDNGEPINITKLTIFGSMEHRCQIAEELLKRGFYDLGLSVMTTFQFHRNPSILRAIFSAVLQYFLKRQMWKESKSLMQRAQDLFRQLTLPSPYGEQLNSSVGRYDDTEDPSDPRMSPEMDRENLQRLASKEWNEFVLIGIRGLIETKKFKLAEKWSSWITLEEYSIDALVAFGKLKSAYLKAVKLELLEKLVEIRDVALSRNCMTEYRLCEQYLSLVSSKASNISSS